MAASATQRHYRAPCPGCGASAEFQSAQSTHAVCGYCHSTVVRSGEVLSRIGRMDVALLPLLFDFPRDMARVSAEVNRLSNQVLIHNYGCGRGH